MMPSNPTPMEYLLNTSENTAVGSIIGFMTGSRSDHGSHICDSWDFLQCHDLLQQFPEWRNRMPELAKEDPTWIPFIDSWDKLETLLAETYMQKPERTIQQGTVFKDYEINVLLKECNDKAHAIATKRTKGKDHA